MAGEMLAKELEERYRYEDCAVLALSDGGVMVGAQIAAKLHCVLNLLLTSSIILPQENDALAEINQHGDVSFNDMLTAGELEEIQSEYFNYIEQQKLQKIFEMNRLLGDGGLVNSELLKNRTIILVSDGLNSGISLLAATEYLKPIKTNGIIVAVPFASVAAVDKMHILADKIYCLNVLEDLISINHYYDEQDVPSHEIIVKIINHIVLNWK